MSDLAFRLVVVGIVAAVVVVAVVVMQRRGRSNIRQLRRVDLEPGIYLFSSESCDGCRDVRKKLNDVVGDGGYTEFSWENEPDRFGVSRIDAVPATMKVSTDKSASIWFGVLEDSFVI